MFAPEAAGFPMWIAGFHFSHRIFVQCRIYSMTLELTLSSLFTCNLGESHQ